MIFEEAMRRVYEERIRVRCEVWRNGNYAAREPEGQVPGVYVYYPFSGPRLLEVHAYMFETEWKELPVEGDEVFAG